MIHLTRRCVDVPQYHYGKRIATFSYKEWITHFIGLLESIVEMEPGATPTSDLELLHTAGKEGQGRPAAVTSSPKMTSEVAPKRNACT